MFIMQATTYCPYYPVTNYTLVVQSLGKTTILESTEINLEGIIEVETILEENSFYFFHIVVANNVGTIESTPIQISEYNKFIRLL